jgi:glycosyltransferase involved in cell wall biosynthesis
MFAGLWEGRTLHKVAATAGIVVIGRNEGQRLKRCLESALGNQVSIIYVDSGSVDGSAALARSMGAMVIELHFQRHAPGMRGTEG